jgi:ribosomal-protein-alanine N-acetyltransferase
MKIRLETNRLILRPFEYSDAEAMFNNWASDDEVTKYLTWPTHKSIEDTKYILDLWINQYEKPERINFAITLKETNELIGGIDVVGYIDNTPVIGYNLSRKYWNNGYMSEACKTVINYLFSLGYETIRIDAAKDNLASNRVIQKCGGIYLEDYNDYFPLKDKYMTINKYIIRNNK